MRRKWTTGRPNGQPRNSRSCTTRAVPDPDRLRDFGLELGMAGACVLLPGAVIAEAIIGLLYFDRPKRILAAIARCAPDRLTEAPLTALCETLAETGDLDIVGGAAAVADAFDRVPFSWEVSSSLVRLRDLSRAREARQALLDTEQSWAEVEPQCAQGLQ
jgi:hypothetical protein